MPIITLNVLRAGHRGLIANASLGRFHEPLILKRLPYATDESNGLHLGEQSHPI